MPEFVEYEIICGIGIEHRIPQVHACLRDNAGTAFYKEIVWENNALKRINTRYDTLMQLLNGTWTLQMSRSAGCL